MARGRGSGISVDPGRIHKARLDAGLTLADVAGTEVSRTFIHQVENGSARPSLQVLNLIARRTGKPIEYFKRPTKPNAASLELSNTLSLAAKAVHRFTADVRMTPAELEALKLVEVLVRRAGLLALAIKS